MGQLVERLWGVLGDRQADPKQRFGAACALADYDPHGGDGGRQGWAGVSPFVANRLLLAVQQNPSHFTQLRETLRPVRGELIPPVPTTNVILAGAQPIARGGEGEHDTGILEVVWQLRRQSGVITGESVTLEVRFSTPGGFRALLAGERTCGS
jgi:hypothetical protein